MEGRIEALDADAKEYHIVKTTEDLPAEIKERYSLVDASGNTSGATIDIPKDSHIVSINYITTGEHAQNLEYVYITDSGTTSTTYVDMSELVLETEFASGITVTNHIAHGVVDPSSETNSGGTAFLTVGADGFKVAGIKQEIIDRINELDATVGEASVATGNHVAVQVVEADGKLTAVTVSEDNIANADDLAELSAKTVTEIASSNNSISATSAATSNGTVKYDVITDASKIQMSGFTSTDVLSGITSSSSITEAFKEVDKVITDNEETVSAALSDLEATKAEKTALDAEIAARKAVDGQNGDTYVANTSANYISGATSLNDADVKLDTAIKALEGAAQTEIDAIETAVGLGADGTHQTSTGNYTSGATTIEGEIVALDGQVKANADAIDALSGKSVTSVTVNGVEVVSNNAAPIVLGYENKAANSTDGMVIDTDSTTGKMTIQFGTLDCGEYN